MKGMDQFQQQKAQNQYTKPEGQVTVEDNRSAKNPNSPASGDYVDYEEVKD